MEKSDFKVVFSAKYAKGLFAFRAKQDVRYYLNGIHVMPHPQGGIVISATDGHRAAIIHDAEGYADGEYILPLSKQATSAASKIKHDGGYIGFVCFDGSQLLVATDSLFDDGRETSFSTVSYAQYITPIDGRFPLMGRLLKDVSFLPSSTIPVNATYMADAAHFSAKHQGVSFRTQGSESAPLFGVTGIRGEVVILIMQMRDVGCSSEEVPKFCNHLIEAYEISARNKEETKKQAA
jgi:hypothetical protein